MNYQQTFFILIALCFVVACSGGDSATEPRLPTPEILVTAGADTTINEQETLAITGAASGGSGEFTYSWSGPADITIEQGANTSPDAILTAPSLTESTSFELRLTATDTDGKSGSRAFTLTVEPVNELPSAVISMNAQEGYAQGDFPVNVTVTLDASASFDSDPQTQSPAITEYQWQQLSGQDVLGEVDTSSAQLRFVTPNSIAPSELRFMLSVTDQEGGVSTAQVDVTLLGQQGTKPEADAGPGLSVFSGEQIALQGSASSLAGDAEPFIASWTHDYLGSLSIADDSSIVTFAQAPLVQSPTTISFELTIFDQFDNQATDTVSVLVNPQVQTFINDTGMIFSADANSAGSAYQSEYPGQDAQYGLDRISSSGVVDKTGRGSNGFDFTRLNANGDPVDDDSQAFSCIRDNITGLVWEVKQADPQSLHYSEQRFAWFQAENNGNFVGSENSNSSSCNLASGQCNTSAFKDHVNEVGLCGFFDWRIPKHDELQSIVHYGQTASPLIDTNNFPNTNFGNDSDIPLWYWTNQSSADGVSDDVARNAWAIDFATAVDNFLSKSSEHRLRLVRAGRGQQE